MISVDYIMDALEHSKVQVRVGTLEVGALTHVALHICQFNFNFWAIDKLNWLFLHHCGTKPKP